MGTVPGTTLVTRRPTSPPLASTAMRFVLVRHGEPAWVDGGVNRDDPRLTDRGRRQAMLTAGVLAAMRIDHVWVSPKLRARQTSEPFLELTGMDGHVHPFLEEIRSPVWEGTDHDVMEIFNANRRRDPAAQWTGLDGGEAVDAFHDRVTDGFAEQLGALGARRSGHDLPTWSIDGGVDPETTILVFAHAGTNSMLMSLLLGVPAVPWEWERFVTFHASISQATTIPIGDGHAFSLRRLSDVAHLPTDHHTR